MRINLKAFNEKFFDIDIYDKIFLAAVFL